MDEWQIIKEIADLTAIPSSHVLRSIGDDGAVLTPSFTPVLVTDTLVEGTHFLSSAPSDLVGRKLMAVNLSDLAAMGAEPVAALLNFTLPDALSKERVVKLIHGIAACCRIYNFPVVGGDTTTLKGAKSPLVLTATLIGRPIGTAPLYRGGALPGDHLWVTGSLGGSLTSGRHLTFEPRLDLVRQLLHQFDLKAMIDISDGLIQDLNHICQASAVGCRLIPEQIPLNRELQGTFSERLLQGLTDGEDFELLFAVNEETHRKMVREIQGSNLPLTAIGEFTATPGITWASPCAIDLAAIKGYTHRLL